MIRLVALRSSNASKLVRSKSSALCNSSKKLLQEHRSNERILSLLIPTCSRQHQTITTTAAATTTTTTGEGTAGRKSTGSKSTRVLSTTSSRIKTVDESVNIMHGAASSLTPVRRETQKEIRKNACDTIAQMLRTNEECFRRTMEELELKGALENRSINRSSKKKFTVSHFLQVYFDSIPGFSSRLLQRLEDEHGNNTNSDNDIFASIPLEDMMDELNRAGFGSSDFAMMHRSFITANQRYAAHLSRMTSKSNQLERQHRKLKIFKADRSELELEIQKRFGFNGESIRKWADRGKAPPPRDINEEEKQTDHRTAQEAGSNNNTTSLFQRTIDSVSALLAIGLKTPHTFDTHKPSSSDHALFLKQRNQSPSLKRMIRKWKRLSNMADRAERSIANLNEQMTKLRYEQSSLVSPLSVGEFKVANQVMQSVLLRLCPALASHVRERHALIIERYRTLDAKTDLTKPHEWYPHARLDRRKIIFHGGPTNSGKTHYAIQRLKKVNRGVYLGPLRLLAAEIYENLTSQGVYCNLYTGQEQREIQFSTHSAATVEMAPTTQDFDVAVIDEIQMIADPFRGFAWTRALLGLRCREIHVCGGLEAEAILRRIAKSCGDDFELRTYERFGELKVSSSSIAPSGDAKGYYAKRVRPGDCIVAFSRKDIFAIQREIEGSTNYKCCVIYGLLPPGIRTDQARRFNDPNSGYDILVASDAIGMGLNLSIRRIIFNSILKWDGTQIVRLDHSSVKQIAGRAGRRNSPYPDGEVTCRCPEDMAYLRECMSTNVPSIDQAGLLPTATHIESFNAYLFKYDNADIGNASNDNESLHSAFSQFSEMATLQGDYFLCRQTTMNNVARMIDGFSMSVSDKYTFCMAPTQPRLGQSMAILKKFAEKYSNGEMAGLNHRNMVAKPPKSFEDISSLCSIHHDLELFLWLSIRFPGNHVERQAALTLKEQAISYINEGLAGTEKLELSHCYVGRDMALRKGLKSDDESETLFPDFW